MFNFIIIQVGYRSNLRTSHSISDLSYATNVESRISRVQHRPGKLNTFVFFFNYYSLVSLLIK